MKLMRETVYEEIFKSPGDDNGNRSFSFCESPVIMCAHHTGTYMQEHESIKVGMNAPMRTHMH